MESKEGAGSRFQLKLTLPCCEGNSEDGNHSYPDLKDILDLHNKTKKKEETLGSIELRIDKRPTILVTDDFASRQTLNWFCSHHV